jgi:hypothetical protein
VRAAQAKRWKDPISTNKLHKMAYVYNLNYVGSIGRRIAVRNWHWARNMRHYLKNN